ncbi:MAG: RNA-guided pseudouridylation complex pseudouridine synthase subunit Cbf5, partial [Nanoarchaeota archaeon]
QTLLKSGKEYIGLMHLHKKIDDELIYKTAEGFVGKIKQLPPIRSAVKRQLRTREIYYLNILEINDKDVLFKIGSEAGFYVRKFCHDFGIKLKTQAHMIQLVRTKVGMFNDKSWKTLHDLKDAYVLYKEKNNEKYIREIILPIEKAVEHLPKIWVHDSAISTLCHGADLSIPGINKYNNFDENETIAIMTLKNELICLGNTVIDHEYIKKNDKGKVVKVNKVFMERDLYPKRKPYL